MIMKTIIDNNNNNNNNLLLYDHEDEHPEPDKGWQPGSSKSCLKVSIWERFLIFRERFFIFNEKWLPQQTLR